MIEAVPEAQTPPAPPSGSTSAPEASRESADSARVARDRAAFATTLLAALGLAESGDPVDASDTDAGTELPADTPTGSDGDAELSTEGEPPLSALVDAEDSGTPNEGPLLDGSELVAESGVETTTSAIPTQSGVADGSETARSRERTGGDSSVFRPLDLTRVGGPAGAEAPPARGDELNREAASSPRTLTATPAPTAGSVAAADSVPSETTRTTPATDPREFDARSDGRSPAPSTAPPPLPSPDLARSDNESALTAGRVEPTRPEGARALPELPVRNETNLIEQARLLLNRNGGQARLELHPPQLGHLGLRIQVTPQGIQLDIMADRFQIAELISRHLPDLQQALAYHGLQVDRANVEFRDRAPDQRSHFGQDANTRSDRDAPRDDARSDGRGNPALDRRFLPAYSLGAIDLHA